MKNTIGIEGCACGDYESDNLIASASCRKSGHSGVWSRGMVHKLEYKILNPQGWLEVGAIVENMLGYGADGVVLVPIEES